MDSDFKPVKRPAVSGQNKTYALPETKPPEPVETDSQITPDEDIDLVSDGDDVTEEQIEKNDNSQPETTAAVAPKTKTDWQQKLQKLKLHWPPGKKELAVAVVLLLLCLIGGLLYVTHHHSKKPVAHVVKQVVKPKPPTTVASTLSGLQVNPDLNKLPVTGVMIENSTDARHQSGQCRTGSQRAAILRAMGAWFQCRLRPCRWQPRRSSRHQELECPGP